MNKSEKPCLHCGQEPVQGPWSELCEKCAKVMHRNAFDKFYPNREDDGPDDIHDWGIPDPWIGRR